MSWVSVVLEFALAIGCFLFYMWLVDMDNNPRYRIDGVEGFKAFFIFMMILCIATMFLHMVKALALSKLFICVCEDGIYGVAGKSLYFSTQPFDLSYKQITNVTKGNIFIGNIKIEAGPHIYASFISEPAEIIALINERIGR
jgi:hypothetical protein